MLQRQDLQEHDASRAEVLQFISDRLGTIREIFKDPEMQRWLKRCAESRRVEGLRRLEDRDCS